jgi:hypothetical protein
MQPKVGGKSSPKAKYMARKMKRTLRRESKAPETVRREAMNADNPLRDTAHNFLLLLM